jgi:hypothetical protein
MIYFLLSWWSMIDSASISVLARGYRDHVYPICATLPGLRYVRTLQLPTVGQFLAREHKMKPTLTRVFQ